jgi:hypothetical protein
MADDNDTMEKVSLYDQIVEVTGLEPEADEAPEDFKGRVVRHFSDLEDEEYDKALEDRDDLAIWVRDATSIYKANRSSRSKKALPVMTGLAGDVEPEKPARRTRGEGKKTSEPKEHKERDPNKPFGKRELAATFDPAPDGANVSKFLVTPLRQHGYKKQADRNEAGHIVYKHEDGHEIHVGPGKMEKAYLMGWRPHGENKHRYGGETLDQYLSERAKGKAGNADADADAGASE